MIVDSVNNVLHIHQPVRRAIQKILSYHILISKQWNSANIGIKLPKKTGWQVLEIEVSK